MWGQTSQRPAIATLISKLFGRWDGLTLRHWRSRPDRGMTLIELMMVVVMLAILIAMVVPQFSANQRDARATTMAGNILHVRDQINIHGSRRDVAVSAEGFPLVIEASWFRGGTLPDHAWTLQSMIVETVAGPADARFPAVKTFDPATPGDPNAWYNSASGAFCARVPAASTAAETLETFNLANSVSAPSLAATQP